MRPRLIALVAAITVACPIVAAATVIGRPTRGHRVTVGAMVRIPAGDYRPLYAEPGAGRVHVAAFALDRQPVTRAEFLAFVRAQPQWQRSRVGRSFAEASYLADWPAALDAGTGVELRRPVTGVSWFAAKAFCVARGKRLPTLNEWEYTASASETRRDASADLVFRRRILALYAARASATLPVAGSGPANAYGVRDLHGSAWEWTLDVNAGMPADVSHVAGRSPGAQDRRVYCASAAIGVADPANYPAFMRFAVRAGLTARSTVAGLGFRCAAGGATPTTL